MSNIPRWKRRASLGSFLRKKLNRDLKISQKVNEKIWHNKNQKIRIRIVKDDKSVKANLVE